MTSWLGAEAGCGCIDGSPRSSRSIRGAALEPHLAALAFHYFEAARSDSVDRRQGDRVRRAGRQPRPPLVALAYEEAARRYRMALALLDLTDDPGDERRTDLLLLTWRRRRHGPAT